MASFDVACHAIPSAAICTLFPQHFLGWITWKCRWRRRHGKGSFELEQSQALVTGA